MSGRETLPVPVATLLTYAVYGWAAEQKMLTAAGRPRLPARAVRQPVFATQLAMPGWRLTLGAYLARGLEAWGVEPSIAACAAPALLAEDLRERWIALLAEQGWSRPIPPLPSPVPAARGVPATPELRATPPAPKAVPERVAVQPPDVPRHARGPHHRAPEPGVTRDADAPVPPPEPPDPPPTPPRRRMRLKGPP